MKSLFYTLASAGAVFALLVLAPVMAQEKKTTVDETLVNDVASSDPDFNTQGEYTGELGDAKYGAQVIARGDGRFDAVLLVGGLPGDGWAGSERISLSGDTKDKVTTLTGGKWVAKIANNVLSVSGGAKGDLKPIRRKSPSAGTKASDEAIVLFDGDDVDAWENAKILDGNLLGVGIRTKKKFRDFFLHLEFRTPYMPKATGQGRGNSGMYLLDQYECQILDSFGLTGENNECGGFYTIQKPNVNMCFPPLSWQTYDVDFTAAKFDANKKKTANAVVTVKHNGVVIHDAVELPRNTPGGGTNDESAAGALFMQDHGNAVRFRNIWIAEKK
jgi:hypothetical protein